jgi:DNA mismatch repair protein MutL
MLEELHPLLASLGIEADLAGPDAIAVHAFASFLTERGVGVEAFMNELLDRAEDDGFAPGAEEALHEVLDMMACKAAVKAGDRLSAGEVEELLRQRSATERGGSCPHGRPTTIRLTLDELERQFGR